MRTILAAALILFACQSGRRYLGDTRPPAAQRLVFTNYGEPTIPVSFLPNNYITKPYVRGMKRDVFGDVYFRYAWIDTAWKP